MPETKVERPLVVLTNPSWSFDTDNFEPADFFSEAKITDDSMGVLRGRFRRFASTDEAGDGEPSLTLKDFRRLNQHYAICRTENEENFFRAMGRNTRERLTFDEFLLGCSAASPATPHILNSLTGFVRARYIFDYYNTSRSGTLEYEELAWLLGDARRHLGEESQLHQRHVSEVAQELGEVSAVTLRVVDATGLGLCDLRASRRWTGRRVQREIAKELKVPVDGQVLTLSGQVLDDSALLETLAGAAEGAVEVVASLNWDAYPAEPTEPLASQAAGLERLAHVPFEAFYKALVSEQLRGMSRLFRFRRQLFHASKSSGSANGLSTALVGGA